MELIRKCDDTKPFIFISYSRQDSNIVLPFVSNLMHQGYNLWIDLEGLNLGDKWNEKALSMIEHSLCKVFVLFRSSTSIQSQAVYEELSTARDMKRRDESYNIQFVDIEERAENINDLYIKIDDKYFELGRKAEDKEKTKYRDLRQQIKDYMREFGENRLTTFYNDEADLNRFYNVIKDTKVFPSTKEIVAYQNTNNLKVNTNDETPTQPNKEVTVEVQNNIVDNIEEATITDQNDESVKPGKIIKLKVGENVFNTKNQSEAMGKIYALVLNSDPDKLPAVINDQPHVSKELDNRSQFRAAFEFEVAGETVYVGTSFSMLDKLKEISKMCKIIGFDQNAVAFVDDSDNEHKVIDGKLISGPVSQDAKEAINLELQIKSVTNEGAKPYNEATNTSAEENDVEETEENGRLKASATKISSVTVLGETYEVKNQNAAMIKVYEVILHKYPFVIERIMNVQPHVSFQLEKKAQFRTYGEIPVSITKVYVGTSLSFQDKLKYVAKLCEAANLPANAGVFIDSNGNEHFYGQPKQNLV